MLTAVANNHVLRDMYVASHVLVYFRIEFGRAIARSFLETDKSGEVSSLDGN